MYNISDLKTTFFIVSAISLLALGTCATTIESQTKYNKQNPVFKWEGEWQIPENNQASFTIHLNKKNDLINNDGVSKNGNLEGWHCYTTETKIDCAEDNEITLSNFEVINSSVIEGDFKTSYSNIGTQNDKTGRVQLKVIDANTLQWWLKERPTAVPPTPISSKKIELKRVTE